MSSTLKQVDPEIYDLIKKEEERQRSDLEMIPSENFVSDAVREAVGSVLMNKYSEGQPFKRYYQGNQNIDEIEALVEKRALQAFGLSEDEWHVNVQAVTGTIANFAFGALSSLKYDDLTIIQNLRFFAGVYGVPRDERERRISWVLEASGLEGREQLMTASLPGGWKQRVAFGASLMHAPSVLFLDEPTSGVDPLARRALWKMINAMADRGVAVLVTTHYLEEAEQCNRLGFMAAGEVVAEGSPTEMKAMMRGRLFEIIVDNARVATLALREALGHDRVSQFGDRVHVQSESAVAEATIEIRALLDRARVEVLRIDETTFSLEDVFIDVVHRSRDAAVAEAS